MCQSCTADRVLVPKPNNTNQQRGAKTDSHSLAYAAQKTTDVAHKNNEPMTKSPTMVETDKAVLVTLMSCLNDHE
jgi:hypothetical protein